MSTSTTNEREMRELDAWIFVHLFDGKISPRYDLNEQCSQYHRNPAAAMLVLEKCAQRLSPDGGGAAIAIEWQGDILESWRVVETDTANGIEAEAETLPLAICRFARAIFSERVSDNL